MFKIETNPGQWVEVTYDIFRSWCGRRRMGGKQFIGPRFTLFTNERIPANQQTLD